MMIKAIEHITRFFYGLLLLSIIFATSIVAVIAGIDITRSTGWSCVLYFSIFLINIFLIIYTCWYIGYASEKLESLRKKKDFKE